MTRPHVTDIKQGENYSAIVNFGVDRSLEFVPHLVWHTPKRKWNEPWRRREQQSQIIGLERIKLIVSGAVVIEVDCQPVPHVTRLAAGFQPRQLAYAWEAALDYLDRFAGGYPHPRLAEIVATRRELLPLLRRGRVPVDPDARSQAPTKSVIRIFPGRIGGMYSQF